MRWALSGNLCRCTGYQNIVKSVLWAAREDAGQPRETGADSVTTALDEIKIGGLGASRKRVEDNRFIRGRGNYVDDIVLPGMLHMEILRSPLAHARIISIDTSKAWEIPGVRLVLTGEMMATRNLAWMPTLSYDTQAVLATDKVRFQGQEVACVIADDPYIAKDACEAIVVEYEPLPVIVNPTQAMADGRAGDPRRQGEPARQRHLRLGGRRRGRHRRGRSRRPTWSPSSSCTTRARTRRRSSAAGRSPTSTGPRRKLTVYMTTQAPHIIRAAVALVAELPEHMIRIVSPGPRRRLRQQGAGLPGLRHVDPGLDPARAAGEVDRGQDRQPDLHRVRPRHLPRRRDGAAQGRQDPRRPDAHRRRPRRVLLRRPAEQVQDRADALGVRLLRRPGGAPHRAGHVHEQGARRRRLPVLVPGDRGDVLPGADGRRPRPTTSAWTRPSSAARNFVRDDDFPHRTAVRLPHRLRAVRQVPGRGTGRDRLRGVQARPGGGARSAAGCWASASRP